jgi:DNA-binding NtrC family response regulator
MPPETESICILGEDASVRRSIEQLLDSDGLHAQGFEEAEDLFAYARDHAVPLAVLDVWLPETSGLQTRLRPASPDTRVILITGRKTTAIRAAALAAARLSFSKSRSTTRRTCHAGRAGRASLLRGHVFRTCHAGRASSRGRSEAVHRTLSSDILWGSHRTASPSCLLCGNVPPTCHAGCAKIRA